MSTLNLTDSQNNSFIGRGCGNNTVTGSSNSALGYNCLGSITGGNNNTAIGYNCLTLNQGGGENTAVGYDALANSVNASQNTCFGVRALEDCLTGAQNTAIGLESSANITNGTLNVSLGFRSLFNCVSGSSNTALGYRALFSCTGSQNVAVGYGSSFNVTSGSTNVSVGRDALNVLTTGSGNVILGSSCGNSYTSSESNNILIGENLLGTIGESNVIRLGNGTTATFIQGIANVNMPTGNSVVIDPVTNQLGYTAFESYFNTIDLYDEFFAYANEGHAMLPWENLAPIIIGPDGAVAEIGHPGVITHDSFSSGHAALSLGGITLPQACLYLGGGRIINTWIFEVTVLSNFTNSYDFTIGFQDDYVSTVTDSGVYLRYNSDSLFSINIVSKSAGATSTFDTGVAMTLGWHKLVIDINAAATQVDFYLDNVLLGSRTTNIPTVNLQPGFKIVRLDGTIAEGTIQFDMFSLKQTLTTPR